jgi:hypothetical protein
VKQGRYDLQFTLQRFKNQMAELGLTEIPGTDTPAFQTLDDLTTYYGGRATTDPAAVSASLEGIMANLPTVQEKQWDDIAKSEARTAGEATYIDHKGNVMPVEEPAAIDYSQQAGEVTRATGQQGAADFTDEEFSTAWETVARV